MDVYARWAFARTYLYNNSMEGLSGLALVQAWVHVAAKALFVVDVAATCYLGGRQVSRYNRELENNYSNDEELRIRHVPLLLLMGLMSVLSVAANFVGRHVFVDSMWIALPSVLFSAMLYALCYAGSRLKYGWKEVAPEIGLGEFEAARIRELNERDEQIRQGRCHAIDMMLLTSGEWRYESAMLRERREAQSPPPKSKMRLLADKIEQLMEEEQLYLKEGIGVNDIAAMLATNSRYVQQAFNEEIGESFSDYVNRRRVAFAQRLRREHPDWDALTVSTRAGFGSLTTYYRNMRKANQNKQA